MTGKITDSIIYIGVNDRDIDLFESQYKVPNGMAYNSYVILDKKTALMDTVDARKTSEWEINLNEALDGRKLDYIIVQHLEPDHSGSLQKAINAYPEAKIVGSEMTIKMLPQFVECDLAGRTLAVKEGEELSLGSHTLTFVMAPMVHWPEVMVTYEKEDKILFSADAFGKFGTTDADEPWIDEARRYYINIVGKYGASVTTLLGKAANLEIEKICALHGPVLTENIGYYVDLYKTWSSYEPEKKGVFVAVASIHGNTKKAADEFVEILKEKGEENVVELEISRSDISECVAKCFEYDRIVFAAASYDGGVFLPMADLLTHLSAKTWRKRKVGFIQNGSWAPTALTAMKKSLDAMKDISYIDSPVTIMSTVKLTDKEKFYELADAVIAAGKNEAF